MDFVVYESLAGVEYSFGFGEHLVMSFRLTKDGDAIDGRDLNTLCEKFNCPIIIPVVLRRCYLFHFYRTSKYDADSETWISVSKDSLNKIEDWSNFCKSRRRAYKDLKHNERLFIMERVNDHGVYSVTPYPCKERTIIEV